METDKLEKLTANSIVINKLYDEIIQIMDGKKINLNNGITFGVNLMQLVEKYKTFTGSEKKKIVIDVINKIIKEQVEDKNTERDLITFANNVLPTTIDVIISIDKKNIIINTKKLFKKLFSCCN
tara:strand:+ start:310 stop:681 length:372 start_codon:yes stop_codon:yes gene_type:complete